MLDFDTVWENMCLHPVLVLRRCASTSLSGLYVNSGLNWDQFNCGIGAGWFGSVRGAIGYAGGTIGCVGYASSCPGGADGTTGGGWDAGGLSSAMLNYIMNHATNELNL